jgi:hypothetical protein
MLEFREAGLINDVLTVFGERTGLGVTIQTIEPPPGPRADAHIQVMEGNRQWTYLVEVKARVDRRNILQAVQQQLGRFDGVGLFMTPYLAPELAKQCQEMGLQYMDATGNAFLRQEGLYVLLEGHKPDKALRRAEKPMRAFDKTGLRVVFALLVNPFLLQAPYRDIAKAAGVALGTVGWILTDLREHGFLVEDAHGKRRWVDPQRVIQAWTTNFPFRLRERLHPRRFTAKETDWWKTATPEAFGGCWGGEVAAAKLTGDLIPKTVTLYLPEERNAFLAKYRLRADPHGPIEVLDTFWEQAHDLNLPVGIAPPLLVCADLNNIGDPRTLEQAKVIHERYLA